jgi:hypothetical protein
MSGLEAGHVREMLLESSLGAGYVWLTWEKAERSDMSGLGVNMSDLEAEYVRSESLESS